MTMYSENDFKRFKDEPADWLRTEFRRDYGRLMHSPSFRRLQGKTQLFPSHESDFFRNRLTHSLEVAQIAKCIAISLNKKITEKFGKNSNLEIDLDLVEVAGLAHDIGHPPFGHNGEAALDKKMREFGGFEGNAQTLRILSKIEKKTSLDYELNNKYIGFSLGGSDLRVGLNLTFRSLASILKYDNEIPVNERIGDKICKGYYSSEAELVAKIKESVGFSGENFKTIECQIMDIADDIAYSVYDLEDSFKGGFCNLLSCLMALNDTNLFDKIYNKVVGSEKLSDCSIEDVSEALYSIFNQFNFDEKSSDDLDMLLFPSITSKLIASNGYMRTEYTSKLIGDFIRGVDICLDDDPDKIRNSVVEVDKNVLLKIEALKHFNFETIIMSSMLKNVEFRGFELVSTIFECLVDSGGKLLPEDHKMIYDVYSSDISKHRVICDFVAGMTDRYAIEFYGRLKGGGESIFKPI